MSNGEKKTPTKRKPGTLMDDILQAPGRVKDWWAKRKEAESYDDKSGNPCHYGTHVGDKQGMNRQGRTSSVTCHHRKS